MLIDSFFARTLQLSNRIVTAPMREDEPLNEPDLAAFYVPETKGYTDFPQLKVGTGALA